MDTLDGKSEKSLSKAVEQRAKARVSRLFFDQQVAEAGGMALSKQSRTIPCALAYTIDKAQI
eukprot:3361579-Amphidinium_carterae.1